MMTQTQTQSERPNQYPGQCSGCGTRLAAQAGLLGPKVAGRWTVRHRDCSAAPAISAPRPRISSRGGCYACRQTSTRHSQIWEECDHCGTEPIYV